MSKETAIVVPTEQKQSISELTALIHGLNVQEKREASIKIDHNKEESHRVICGVGVVKEKPKTKLEQISYEIWCSMLKRCYENKVGARNRTYASCFVAPNLLDFNVFNTWCLTQVGFNNYDEKGRRFVLDKDILVKGNKIYSEDTCCFVPAEINTLILKSEAIRGEYPIGVHKRGSRFCGRCKVNNKDRFLGYTDTAEEAFYKYKKFKEQHIKDVANKWKDQIDNRVYEALMNYTVEITD